MCLCGKRSREFKSTITVRVNHGVYSTRKMLEAGHIMFVNQSSSLAQIPVVLVPPLIIAWGSGIQWTTENRELLWRVLSSDIWNRGLGEALENNIIVPCRFQFSKPPVLQVPKTRHGWLMGEGFIDAGARREQAVDTENGRIIRWWMRDQAFLYIFGGSPPDMPTWEGKSINGVGPGTAFGGDTTKRGHQGDTVRTECYIQPRM
ncbi:hypothetical protein B0H10DRAFT_1945762 [Mycena sp. CBHHK59/15]|nr:hypothetical protein B0H10DRAFT_1945762 [Mycena sp. CBHHK59/15]